MNVKRYPTSVMLFTTGCLIFDIAVVIGFFKIFGWFVLLAFDRSVVMLGVLLLGLAAINIALLAPGLLYKRIGVAYSQAISFLAFVYAIIANVLSILLITGSLVMYFVWELILLAAVLIIASIFAYFSNRSSVEISKQDTEKSHQIVINSLLADIEALLVNAFYNDEGKNIRDSYKALKERMNASTPFGRNIENDEIFKIEVEIKDNLRNIQLLLDSDSNSETASRIRLLIDNTRILVIKKERLYVH